VTTYIALLRGINIGPRNRIAMGELRDALAEDGFESPRTYLQSGNVVLAANADPSQKVTRLIADRFGLDIAVLVRTRAQLAAVVRHDPFGPAATDPKRYQVTFLEKKLKPEVAEKVEATAVKGELVAVHGREVYAWHASGIARSKLWAVLASRSLGVEATSRNWTTVLALLELAG
jgi:uncharacterized protein (DUF1697 family)